MLVWGRFSKEGERPVANTDFASQAFDNRPIHDVIIIAEFALDVQSYAREFSQIVFPRPDNCPNCGQAGELVGHGSYRRRPCDPEHTFLIRVKRFLCNACHRTISLLPSFCLPHRHYLAETIQSVLLLRIQAGSSWNAIRRRFHPYDLPSLTTCREWVATFAKASPLYVEHLLRQLANWQLAPGRLELAVADISAQLSAPRQLLAAVPHLAAWLEEHRVGLLQSTARWLPTLARWGHAAKLGRVV